MSDPRDDGRTDATATQGWTRAAAGGEPGTSKPGDTLLQPGTMVDHFRVLRLIGKGGMGEVYLARDSKLGRRVALKVLAPKRFGSTSAVERFLFEAKATAQFAHPHIVTIHAVGEIQGYPYVALEYLRGETLHERLQAEQLGVREATRIGLAIAEALQEAHRHKILHRDLKPANVMIPIDGRIRVLDFGLAKRITSLELGDGEHTEDPSTAQDTHVSLSENVQHSQGRGIRGTPSYMSPEQWDEDESTEATDVWGLGMMLYLMLAGHHPYDGLGVHEISVYIGQPEPVPAPPSDLPPELHKLVCRCLEKSPTLRPAMDDVVETLHHYLMRGGGPVTDRSPFRGLLPFHERHARQFYGRETEINGFLERLRESPILPVLGPSGMGKSSFVHAGVIPRLREQGTWLLVNMRPGRRPLRTLATRLLTEESAVVSGTASGSDSGSFFAPAASPSATSLNLGPEALVDAERLLLDELREAPSALALKLGRLAEGRRCRVLLFVDQLEEIFTLVEDEEVRETFIAALCEAADDPMGPVRVVFTLREDFLGRLAAVPATREALNRLTVLGSPGPRALEEILTQPVVELGYRYDDPRLVSQMVSTVQGERAALPMLQFVGRVLWRHRDRNGKKLLRKVYDEVGGVEGALAHHADGVLDRFADEQFQAAREIFLRLVTPEKTRRVLPRDQLLDGLPASADEVLDRLVAQRAILAHRARGGGTAELELVHESLIHNWDRLARWIDEGGEERAFLDELGQAAGLWDQRGRRDDEVWSGDALGDARRRASRLPAVPDLVQQFLDEGARRERRSQIRKRVTLFAGFAILMAVAVALAFQGQNNRAQRDRAEMRHAEALAEGSRAAIVNGDLLEARAKLRSALEAQDSPLVRSLWWQLRREAQRWRLDLGSSVWDVAVSPDGRTVAAATLAGTVQLMDVRTKEIHTLRGHQGMVQTVDFSPDGAWLASTAGRGEMRLWNLVEGSSRGLVGHEDFISQVMFSPSSGALASAGFDGSVRLWSLEDDSPALQMNGHDGYVRSVAFRPDGRVLASSGDDGTVRLWEASTGEPRTVLEGHGCRIENIVFSPDGTLLAAAGWDSTIRVWDTATGETERVLEGHADRVSRVVFSPGGDELASSAWDHTIRLWDLSEGNTTRVLRGHRDYINNVRYSPDGAWIASTSNDRTIRVWELAAREDPRVLLGHASGVKGLGFAPDGSWLASGGDDRTVRVWDLASNASPVAPRGHDGSLYGIAFSPDGRLLASGGKDGTARLWDVHSGEQARVLEGHSDGIRGVAFSPDGRLLATGSMDRTVRLWDLVTGAVEAELKALPNLVAVRFSPDGSHIACHSGDGITRVWNTGSPEQSRDLSGGGWDLSFSPDGRQMATASWNHKIQLWNVATGRQEGELVGHGNEVVGAQFSPDGRQLVSGGLDGSVRLWDLGTRKGRILGIQEGAIYWLDFGPRGERVGAPTSTGSAWLWDLESGDSRELRGHRSEVNALRFGPDGGLVATSSDDGTLRMWDTATGRPAWRTVAALSGPPEVYNHRGWNRPEQAHPAATSTAWRRAVEGSRWADGDGSTVCLTTHDREVQLWDRPSDALVHSWPHELLAPPKTADRGCLVTTAAGALLLTEAGETVLHAEASALGVSAGALLIAAEDGIHVHGFEGALQRSLPPRGEVTAVGMAGSGVTVGYADGGVELISGGGADIRLEETPASPVTALAEGPAGSLAIGWANGTMGLWSIQTGRQLTRSRLHGPISRFLFDADQLLVASELGDLEVLDLTEFQQPYCDLVRQVWMDVPVVWEMGRPVLREAPEFHDCR